MDRPATAATQKFKNSTGPLKIMSQVSHQQTSQHLRVLSPIFNNKNYGEQGPQPTMCMVNKQNIRSSMQGFSKGENAVGRISKTPTISIS